ncbi:hypothetical protein RB195_023207 [Necator americanus]|uniref:Secreted protein n=1 Tax=Necator americanus TaxID=51031 RepID=A0ABR1EIH4_NECAM
MRHLIRQFIFCHMLRGAYKPLWAFSPPILQSSKVMSFDYKETEGSRWFLGNPSETLRVQWITLITLTSVDLRTGRAGATNSSICSGRVPE